VNVDVVAAHEIAGADRQRWLALHRANPQLSSPYFHPEFAAAVAEVRPDARVAVLEQAGDGSLFFPFQVDRLGIGRPLGGGFSDYQAVIAPQHTRFDPRELLDRSGLAVWEFDHLIAAQKPFRPFHERVAGSPILDLSSGFAAYLRARREATDRLSQLQRKIRKLERENGGLEFVAHQVDHSVLDLVIRWKSNQCRRTGVLDFFSELHWTVPLLRRLLETNSDGFSGVLSTLRLGGRIAAVHFGMRSERALHYWFPTFDPDGDYAKYSPGSILLLKLAEHAAGLGLSVLDLGKGDEAYKSSFMTGSIAIAEGAVATESWPAALWHARRRSRRWLRATGALAPLRKCLWAYRQLRAQGSRAR
jgi:CelD/BcsL family acetyltransferase involved in cellulose biosynthesis